MTGNVFEKKPQNAKFEFFSNGQISAGNGNFWPICNIRPENTYFFGQKNLGVNSSLFRTCITFQLKIAVKNKPKIIIFCWNLAIFAYFWDILGNFAKMRIFRDRQKFLSSKFFWWKIYVLTNKFCIIGQNRPSWPLKSGRFLTKTIFFKKWPFFGMKFRGSAEISDKKKCQKFLLQKIFS